MYIVHIILLLQRKCVIRVINMFVNMFQTFTLHDAQTTLKNAEKIDSRNCISSDKKNFLEIGTR